MDNNVLPQMWFLKITEDNKDYINSLNLEDVPSNLKPNMVIGTYWNNILGYDYNDTHPISCNATEITLYQFKKHFLKKDYLSHNLINGGWFIKVTHKNYDTLRQWMFGFGDTPIGFNVGCLIVLNHHREKSWQTHSVEFLLLSDYVEITDYVFKNDFLDKINIPEKTIQLELNKVVNDLNKYKKEMSSKEIKIYKEYKLSIGEKSIKRLVTIAVVADENNHVKVGYSIKHPDDKNQEDLSKRIALGRANNDKTNLIDIDKNFLGCFKERYILYAIADEYAKRIESGRIIIKGIRDGKK